MGNCQPNYRVLAKTTGGLQSERQSSQTQNVRGYDQKPKGRDSGLTNSSGKYTNINNQQKQIKIQDINQNPTQQTAEVKLNKIQPKFPESSIQQKPRHSIRASDIDKLAFTCGK